MYCFISKPVVSNRLQTAIDSSLNSSKEWQLAFSPQNTNLMQFNVNSPACMYSYI